MTFVISGGEVKPIITISGSATIFQLKKRITEHTGVPVGRQNLLYDNVKLPDLSTVDQYKFGAIVELILAVDLYPDERVMDITVSSPAFRVRLRVNKVHKVIQLKEKVREMFSIPIKEITLWYMSKKMQDDKPLYKYYVSEGSDVQFTRTGFYT